MVDAPDVVPMIACQDGPAAMDWLAAAFGFREQTRWVDDDGVLSHGEMVAGKGLIMLATPTPDYEGPAQHRAPYDHAAGRLTDSAGRKYGFTGAGGMP